MEVLTILQNYGILNIAVIVGITGIVSQMRKQFLDELLTKINKSWMKWLILTIICLILSSGLSALGFITKFILQEWVKMSIMNWIFTWVFHDAIKNLFFKK